MSGLVLELGEVEATSEHRVLHHGDAGARGGEGREAEAEQREAQRAPLQQAEQDRRLPADEQARRE